MKKSNPFSILDNIIGGIILIPILLLLVVIVIAILPLIMLFVLFDNLLENYKRKVFLKNNEGRIFFCITNGNRQLGFVKNHRKLIEERASIIKYDYNTIVDDYNFIKMIDDSLGFPQVVKIEHGKIRAKSFKKEYKALSNTKSRTTDFVSFLWSELQELTQYSVLN